MVNGKGVLPSPRFGEKYLNLSPMRTFFNFVQFSKLLLDLFTQNISNWYKLRGFGLNSTDNFQQNPQNCNFHNVKFLIDLISQESIQLCNTNLYEFYQSAFL